MSIAFLGPQGDMRTARLNQKNLVLPEMFVFGNNTTWRHLFYAHHKVIGAAVRAIDLDSERARSHGNIAGSSNAPFTFILFKNEWFWLSGWLLFLREYRLVQQQDN